MRGLWRRFLNWLLGDGAIPEHEVKLLARPSPIPNITVEEALREAQTALDTVEFLIDHPEHRADGVDEHALGQRLLNIRTNIHDMTNYLRETRS